MAANASRTDWKRGVGRILVLLYFAGVASYALVADQRLTLAHARLDAIDQQMGYFRNYSEHEAVRLTRLATVPGNTLSKRDFVAVDEWIRLGSLRDSRSIQDRAYVVAKQEMDVVLTLGVFPALLLAIVAAVRWVWRGFLAQQFRP